MLLGLSSSNSDSLSVCINGYIPVAPFRENSSISFNYCLISIDTIILGKVLIFYLRREK